MKKPSLSFPLRLGLTSIVVAIALFALWAWLAPLHGAIVSVGQVKAAHNRKLVQHTDGGIVKRILVANGDAVAEGQPLLELEDVKIDANLQLIQELMVFETVKRERLDAEQQLSERFVLDASQRERFPALSEKAYQRELKIFRTRRGLLDEQVASYRRQLEAITQEQAALRQQAEASGHAARLARDELGLNEGLVKEKFISRARLIALERAVAEYGAKQGEHEAALAQSEQRKNDIGLRIVAIRAEYQRLAAEEHKESHARLVQMREQLRPAEDAARRKHVVAPVAGKVVGLRLNAPGEVAPPREPLMEIVPAGEALIVEARAGVDAIRHLHPGQEADLRFTTFNARTTPLVKGKLIYVSADATVDKDGMPFYVIQIEPVASSLKSAGIPALQPGMAAEVYVLLEARTVVDYLFAPITETLYHTLREP